MAGSNGEGGPGDGRTVADILGDIGDVLPDGNVALDFSGKQPAVPSAVQSVIAPGAGLVTTSGAPLGASPVVLGPNGGPLGSHRGLVSALRPLPEASEE